jgi:ring-1,2-phenylacetyl-CoA epoxidase subunit PaaC
MHTDDLTAQGHTQGHTQGHDAPDNAYGGLVEADSDARWAFGTGFDDPLAGLDVSVPGGIDRPALAAYCLMLGDDALVLAQRLTHWCTRAPELEEEVALANLALDLLGQTRLLYARAAAADPAAVPALPEGSPVPPEDRLAFFRDADGFRSVWLAELPDRDFAAAVLRLLVLAAWRRGLWARLTASRDPVLAAVAAKAVKESAYHVEYAARWVTTLADGTPESRRRLLEALAELWPYTAELGRPDPVTDGLVAAGVAADPAGAWHEARSALAGLLDAVGVALPVVGPASRDGRAGRAGVHTRWLPPLLEELQGLARRHPMGRW